MSPYRSAGPIFVRKAAVEVKIEPGYSRLYSYSFDVLRAYDSSHLMTDASVCAGNDTASTIQKCSVPMKSRISTCITRTEDAFRASSIALNGG